MVTSKKHILGNKSTFCCFRGGGENPYADLPCPFYLECFFMQ